MSAAAKASTVVEPVPRHLDVAATVLHLEGPAVLTTGAKAKFVAAFAAFRQAVIDLDKRRSPRNPEMAARVEEVFLGRYDEDCDALAKPGSETRALKAFERAWAGTLEGGVHSADPRDPSRASVVVTLDRDDYSLSSELKMPAWHR